MPTNIDVLTYLDKGQSSLFESMKRRRFEPWVLIGAGEWSQTSYHQGNLTLFVSHNSQKELWRAMVSTFGKRVVAVARTAQHVSVEQAAAAMFQALKHKDGEYVDSFSSAGEEIDIHEFWRLYESRDIMYSAWN